MAYAISSCFLNLCVASATYRLRIAVQRRTGQCRSNTFWMCTTQMRKRWLLLDNLNTHTGASLYEVFEPSEARRLLDRLQFHYTPKHGSWLNMAEIELNVLSLVNALIAVSLTKKPWQLKWLPGNNDETMSTQRWIGALRILKPESNWNISTLYY